MSRRTRTSTPTSPGAIPGRPSRRPASDVRLQTSRVTTPHVALSPHDPVAIFPVREGGRDDGAVNYIPYSIGGIHIEGAPELRRRPRLLPRGPQ